jgi:hypothetical protein
VLGAARFTGELIGAVDLVLADSGADQRGEDDEAEPAPDRDLAVVGTPMGDAGGEVPALQRSSWLEARDTTLTESRG